MNKQPGTFLIFFFIVIIFILPGCAPLRPRTDPGLDQKARLYAASVTSANLQIESSKGTGWAKFETDGNSNKFRIAWAARFPNKLRITFLMSGHPVETIVSTGEKITFFSHTGEHAKYSSYSKDPDMEDYIKIPVKLSEMILVLLGRFPVNRFDDAYFSPSDDSLSTIHLLQKWNNKSQTLHIDSAGKLDKIKTFDELKNCVLDFQIQTYKPYTFGTLPQKIQIKDSLDRKLVLEITNFWPNLPIKDTVFQLTEAG